jgi:hypothetical protein
MPETACSLDRSSPRVRVADVQVIGSHLRDREQTSELSSMSRVMLGHHRPFLSPCLIANVKVRLLQRSNIELSQTLTSELNIP